MKINLHIQIRRWILIIIILSFNNLSFGVTKTSIASGNWNNPSCWSPTGVPAVTDNAVISSNTFITYTADHSIKNLTVNENSKISGTESKTLTINENITVNGSFDMNGGEINCPNSYSVFTLGPQSAFTWNPSTNLSSHATLFLNCKESIDPSSTLIIKKWFDYTVPIGSVVKGNFGNLTINTPGGNNSIVEWNQNNFFESHKVKGTLKIEQGWVTLDKSGEIKNTTIGKIVLTSLNSTFIAHNGNHSSSFLLHTYSVNNSSGKFYGINDGNGNISLAITSDFINSGNVKMINNSGVQGTSNGNASLTIGGRFSQSGGDTRIIYNVSTTNSGIYNCSITNLELTGGIFMGQSACHTAGLTNSLDILNNLNINFSNPADKFRGNGITSIGNTINNSRLNFHVGGNININGTTLAEFTTSASSGKEELNFDGDVNIKGCTSSFNYGTIQGSHETALNITGKLVIDGGTLCLSRNNGPFNGSVKKDLNVRNGLLVIKGGNGSSTLTANGKLNISGGTILMHSNAQIASTEKINLICKGSFNSAGGEIIFDDNSTGAQHEIILQGDSIKLSGTGMIRNTAISSGGIPGLISYSRSGKIIYQNLSNQPALEGIQQRITAGCELEIKSCQMQLSAFSQPAIQSLSVGTNANLFCNNGTIKSTGTSAYCRLQIDSSGKVTVRNENGFYGLNTSALSSTVKYTIHSKGIIEYNGEKNQKISSLSGNSQSSEKYGILRINIDDPYHAILANNISVSTQLQLLNGKLKLNDHTITIENGNANGIARSKGYIESTIGNSLTGNNIRWKNVKAGTFCFPFGKSVTEYLPVTIKASNASEREIVVSTSQTENNNLPYPDGISPISGENNFNSSKLIDRWWKINTSGSNANIELTIGRSENPVSEHSSLKHYKIYGWTGSVWVKMPDSEFNSATNKISTHVSESNPVSFLAVVCDLSSIPAIIDLHTVIRSDNDVILKWNTEKIMSASAFTIEKSEDGINFFQVGELNDLNWYADKTEFSFTDKNAGETLAFYRIRITEAESYDYSKIKKVDPRSNSNPSAVKINSVTPNPFTSAINIDYNCKEGKTTFKIIDSQGRIVFKELTNNPPEGLDHKNINLENLKSGTYLLSIDNGTTKDTQKIIKN